MTTRAMHDTGSPSTLHVGGRAALWLSVLALALVMLYVPFTGESALRMMAWTWPIGGVLMFLAVRGIGNATSGHDERHPTREDEVGRWLGQLTGRCQVLRYVTVGGRSIEYVVVAPSGIYAMQTRNHRTRIAVRDAMSAFNGRGLPRDLLGRLRADAAALQGHLASGGVRHGVRPLLVFTDARIDVREVDGVTMLPLRWLDSWVRNQPQVMSPLECSLVGAALKREARATITR